MKNRIQKPDWKVFEAKFSGKEQESFQWLCHLLFCKQYNKPQGPDRYFNQAGIETAPIQVALDCIGWQAKYYITPLSKHTQDFVGAIDTAKKNYPELTKIIFYTNRDFGPGRDGKDPKGKTTVETHATSKGVAVEWRTASYFESPFVSEDTAVITKHFFELDKSIFDLIAELKQHTESVLGLIQADIQFDTTVIKLDKSSITSSLIKSLAGISPIVLSGNGGVGKTAVIKDLYNLIKSTTPFFLFKATEFNNISNTNELVRQYGDFTFLDFVTAYNDTQEKCIVIDSAEKLSDLDDQTVFQEFLRLLIDNSWKIIFTTRRSYLDDLKYLLIGIYRVAFTSIDMTNISLNELDELAKKFSLTLPSDEHTKELICNPFYLNEYIQNQTGVNKDVSATDLKEVLWNKQIAKTFQRRNNMHIRRAEAFVEVAKRRAEQGSFLVKSNGIDADALGELANDEIVGYDSKLLGYFIAHDIYEEWALEKIIEAAFQQYGDNPADFYKEIGSSLPIRRIFRSWLTGKLADDKDTVKVLVENTVNDGTIDAHWRDEVLVSIMLSDKASDFINLFGDNLLDNDGALLVRLMFLLRIACKEIDEAILRILGAKSTNQSLDTLFTQPKGSGWDAVIAFVNDHKVALGLNHISSVLPIIKDWTAKRKSGATTKHAAQIALFYYEKTSDGGGFGYGQGSRQLKKDVVDTIRNGASELRDELSSIANKVITNKQTSHRDKYRDLIDGLLSSSYETAFVAQTIPIQLLQLAELYWTEEPDNGDLFRSTGVGVEGYFGISQSSHHEYYPSSAHQTPIYMLLRFAPVETIDFILRFTNRAAELYAKSELDKNGVEKVKVHFKEDETTEQFISARLWEMYRGTHVNPGVLESMHMALEKWLLEQSKSSSPEALEKTCLHLLKLTKSASITAVVASIVVANSEKLFNIAAILFKTKEFFFYDTSRFIKDRSHRSTLTMLEDQYFSSYEQKMHQDERIKSCDESHRSQTLENVALSYQWFRSEGITEEESEKRRSVLWKIWDSYYKQLPNEKRQTDEDRTWRLYLARMDSRKMTPKTEQKDKQLYVTFETDMDAKLREYSNNSMQKTEEAMKHSSLMVWSHDKWRGEENDNSYPQYANNPSVVIEEVKDIIKDFKDPTSSITRDFMDRSTISYACAVLVRDYFDRLTDDEKNYCKETLLQFALIQFDKQYDVTGGDGIDVAVNVLPLLLGIDAESDEIIKTVLLLSLFNTSSVGAYDYMYNHSSAAILHRLWKTDPRGAQSIFVGYLLLSPKWKELRETVRKNNIAKKVYETTPQEVIEALDDDSEADIKRIINNEVTYSELQNIEEYGITTLEVAFELLPYRIADPIHRQFLDTILPLFAKKLLDDRDKVDYMVSHRFFDKFANFVLTVPQEDVARYIKPFVDGFNDSRNMGEMLQRFVSVQDHISQHDEFWMVWDAFYDKVVEIANDSRNAHYARSIVVSYLFAATSWKDGAREWHTLQEDDKKFFQKVIKDMGRNPAVLYSIAKLLKGIGSHYTDEGIGWLSVIIESNKNLESEDLETNTVYCLENVVRRFVVENRKKIKASQPLRSQLLTILDFLIQKGSVVAYLTREDIL